MSFDECDPEYGGDQCYTGELEYIVQCTSKCKKLYISYLFSFKLLVNFVYIISLNLIMSHIM